MLRCKSTIVYIILLLVLCTNSITGYINYHNYTSLCGVNITLTLPIESVQINFNLPKEVAAQAPQNCSCYINWQGPSDLFLFSAITKLPGFVDETSPHIILQVYDNQGKELHLVMKEPKEYYLTVTPVMKLNKQSDDRCSRYYVPCGDAICIHNILACDGVMQCPGDEIDCPYAPSNSSLIVSIFSVLFSFLFASSFLALFAYYCVFRTPEDRLAQKGKQMQYGTLNGSLNSQSSISTDQSMSPEDQSGHFYNENLQKHFENFPINKNKK